MNYMPGVAKMLSVEINEKFNIIQVEDQERRMNNPFWFEEEFGIFNKEGRCSDGVILALLSGVYEIKKLPWRPVFGEKYWYVKEDGQIREKVWHGHDIAFYRYNAGNCFRTAEEITPGIKENILQEMKGKYDNG